MVVGHFEPSQSGLDGHILQLAENRTRSRHFKATTWNLAWHLSGCRLLQFIVWNCGAFFFFLCFIFFKTNFLFFFFLPLFAVVYAAPNKDGDLLSYMLEPAEAAKVLRLQTTIFECLRGGKEQKFVQVISFGGLNQVKSKCGGKFYLFSFFLFLQKLNFFFIFLIFFIFFYSCLCFCSKKFINACKKLLQ